MTATFKRILLATDTASLSAQYAPYLESKGFSVRCLYTGRDVVNALVQSHVELVVADLHLPDGDAPWIIDQLEQAGLSVPMIVTIPAHFDAASGALGRRVSMLKKPVSVIQLHQAIVEVLQSTTSGADDTLPADLAGTTDDIAATNNLKPQAKFGGFIGTSPVMLKLYEQIQNAARSTATVFITGESGTGKEVCANAIHRHSGRAGRPFVPLNCAAIPRDLLESELFGHVRGAFTGAVSDRDGAATQADGGTLFLDEIGDMDPNMQTKLLRFLQDGTFQRVGGNRLERGDVRIICATNREPLADVRAGRFREDLYYRLHVLPVSMPRLRERGDDVIDIAQTLLLTYAHEERKRFKAFAPEAESILRTYTWPGNIRQLQNIVRQVVVMHDGLIVTPAMFPPELMAERPAPVPDQPRLGEMDGSLKPVPSSPDEAPETMLGARDMIIPLHILERRAIERAIRICAGNIPRAAALLQVSPSTLYRKKSGWDAENTVFRPDDTPMPSPPARANENASSRVFTPFHKESGQF